MASSSWGRRVGRRGPWRRRRVPSGHPGRHRPGLHPRSPRCHTDHCNLRLEPVQQKSDGSMRRPGSRVRPRGAIPAADRPGGNSDHDAATVAPSHGRPRPARRVSPPDPPPLAEATLGFHRPNRGPGKSHRPNRGPAGRRAPNRCRPSGRGIRGVPSRRLAPAYFAAPGGVRTSRSAAARNAPSLILLGRRTWRHPAEQTSDDTHLAVEVPGASKGLELASTTVRLRYKPPPTARSCSPGFVGTAPPGERLGRLPAEALELPVTAIAGRSWGVPALMDVPARRPGSRLPPRVMVVERGRH